MLPFSLPGFEIQQIHRIETTVIITARALSVKADVITSRLRIGRPGKTHSKEQNS